MISATMPTEQDQEGASVLVVDDEPTIADVVAYIDGLLARQAKARGADPPDLHAAT